jgi:chitodextrinase
MNELPVNLIHFFQEMLAINPKTKTNKQYYPMKFHYELKKFNVLMLLIGFVGFCANQLVAATASSISQYGITWTFSQSHTVGQYANGDWWVLGPVSITSISPASTTTSGWTKNGTQVNPDCSQSQGFDSSPKEHSSAVGASWDPTKNLHPSFTGSSLDLNAGSVISTISRSRAAGRPQLSDMAILTVVSSTPSAGDFRPGPSDDGNTNRVSYWNESDLDYSILHDDLTPSTGLPSLAATEALFVRPWAEFMTGSQARYVHASNNQAEYGRDIADEVGQGLMLLHMDYTQAQKRDLYVRMVQLGIDVYSAAQSGCVWDDLGGINPGHKAPLVLAALALNDSGMMTYADADNHFIFQEDRQIWYVTQADVGRPLYQGDGRPREEYTQVHVGLPEWGEQHTRQPVRDGSNWNATYRSICQGSLITHALAMQLTTGAVDLWTWDAFFDYQDRAFAIDEPVAGGTNRMTVWERDAWNAFRNVGPPSGSATEVSTPNITPNGGSFLNSVDVIIEVGTPGATIYYTDDGSTPTASSTLYTGSFTLTSSKTIKAIGIKSGLTDSDIVSAIYTVTADTFAPQITSVPDTNDPYALAVIFDEQVDSVTAETTSNYSISGGITVNSATLATDGLTVYLGTSELSATTYTLTVNNVEDLSGNAIAANTQATFDYIFLSVVASCDDGNVATNTVDGDLGTRWSCDVNGAWIDYDLGSIQTISSVDIAFFKGNERSGIFDIEISTDGTNAVQVFSGSSSGTTLQLENFDFTDTTGRFVTIIGYGNSANAWNSITELQINTTTGGDTQAPSVPTGLTSSNVTTSTVDLDWNPSTDNIGVTSYNIYINGANPINVTGTSVTVSGLTENTSYTFTVSAADAASNESAQSSGESVTTATSGGSGSVTTYQAEDASLGGGTVSDTNHTGYNGSGFVNLPSNNGYLEWTSVNGDSGGSATLDLRYALNSGSRTVDLIINGSPQSLTFTATGAWDAWSTTTVNVSLNSGSSNTIRIESIGNDSGNIDEMTVTTSGGGGGDTQAPSVPTGLVSSNVTTTTVDLDWNASTDNVAVTGYNVYIDGANPVSVTGTSVTVSGLTESTNYSFTVSAIDAASNESSQSSSINVTTQGSISSATYEAEDYTSTSGCSVATNQSGYTGSGFVDFGGNGTWAEWNNINVGSGSATLTIRYASNDTNNRQCAIEVNGVSEGNISFAPTGSWTTWTTETIVVPLNAGNNTIRITANTSEGGPNIDYIDIQ